MISAFLTLLVILCSLLYLQNQSFRKANRELIIQNDSVMAANIELRTLTNNLINNAKQTSTVLKRKKNGDRTLN